MSVTVHVAGLYLQVAAQSTFRKCYTIGDNEYCFKTYLNSMKTFDDARKYCESISDGPYSLAAVDDGPVHNALADFMDLSDFFSEYVWLGITQRTRGQWFWTDETPYTGRLSALPATELHHHHHYHHH